MDSLDSFACSWHLLSFDGYVFSGSKQKVGYFICRLPLSRLQSWAPSPSAVPNYLIRTFKGVSCPAEKFGVRLRWDDFGFEKRTKSNLAQWFLLDMQSWSNAVVVVLCLFSGTMRFLAAWRQGKTMKKKVTTGGTLASIISVDNVFSFSFSDRLLAPTLRFCVSISFYLCWSFLPPVLASLVLICLWCCWRNMGLSNWLAESLIDTIPRYVLVAFSVLPVCSFEIPVSIVEGLT